ncbi:DNA repair protein RecN (Recombination protein N) [Actinokineospora baliensis]|uniref:DNA repair protein RecN n=1 Tax=Actinokineospora baliensis TaxID=547056 RepID=UPI001EF7DCAF|nr:DNA repair protein RecN [Actinokineospora baliensis]MBM7773005.1 DNA repair protein RecN (Recombination protein N) [Actinokineospora baliensis]
MRIQDLGVIDEATLELHPGFTVVTGETGAGKTMVVTGLHLLSGGRGEASRVRSGKPKAVVEGRFEELTGTPAAVVATEAGAEPDDDGSLITLRSVSTDGRSRAHVGGRSVPVGVLQDLAEQLIAVHGQNDQLRLLRPAEQRAVIDRFAGTEISGVLAEYRSVREQWLAVTAELDDRTKRARELAREAEILRMGLDEITAVDPQPGEDTELVEQARRLADADQLREAATGASYAVSGSPDGDPDVPGALGLIGEAQRRVSSSEDPRLRELESRLTEAAVLLTDVGAELTAYLDGLDADPAALERVLARQAELKSLTRKYAADADGVLAWARDAVDKLSGLDTSEEALGELAARKKELAVRLGELAAALTEARSVAAEALAKAVTDELGGLAMGQSSVQISVRPRPAEAGDPVAIEVNGVAMHAGADGVDDVELLLVAHDGAQPLPVHKGASGGELSRVMLAIEVVLAHTDPVPTLVFDEVDAGVGGRAAVEIGRRLARLARSHQVIVVTHLAQVAAFADRHLIVDKGIHGGVTRSDVRTLGDDERVVELARMLAGMESTETGRAHAEELLGLADGEKHDWKLTGKPRPQRKKRQS